MQTGSNKYESILKLFSLLYFALVVINKANPPEWPIAITNNKLSQTKENCMDLYVYKAFILFPSLLLFAFFLVPLLVVMSRGLYVFCPIDRYAYLNASQRMEDAKNRIFFQMFSSLIRAAKTPFLGTL